MSRIKDHLIGLCNERDEALCALGGLVFDNSSPLFYGHGTLIPPSLEFDQSFPHCGYYALLLTQLENIMDVARLNSEHNFKRVVYSMAYSHSITLFESYISQSLVALTTQYSNFSIRITQQYDPSGTIKKDGWRKVLESEGGLKGLVIEGLSKDVFHNLKTVKNVFGLMFDEAGRGIDIGPLEAVIERRHDIVHRNGTSVTGETLMVEFDMLERDVMLIRKFANDLKERMTSAVLVEGFSTGLAGEKRAD
ncbi:hypothetical protein HU762_04515 [Pseudomonas sp. SWRI92]|uniref:hypothetical protein n=1 Tax=Pseudomonas sp. SWRI92 TaxID=2745499 RepID=UPI001647E067|nr:hypothetical protein [Pseudomonas sp. SWRI92]MBC3373199.1 hypothetical protein [Pseudomonas sp. SWRI92]